MLSTGQRLGPYEIESPAGKGGMGEVYRARDTRLDRIVAIKVLPSHSAMKADMRVRFEREAKTISSLNHPNVCTLHDVGHEDGIDFLVMEFLEGEPLDERLKRSKFGANEALEIGSQIARALDAAHRKGLVHRDLKPSNIFLTKEGAKLLDFGLAKMQAEAITGMDDETRTTPVTGTGVIVGTLQYMSPEQLEGQEADERSDIFALGATLYEMLTGERAFTGTSKASLIGSIMKESPEPISASIPTTPPSLDRLIRKCLMKDPDDRWQTARDLGDELRWIASSTDEHTAVSRWLRPTVLTRVAMLILVAAVIMSTFLMVRANQEKGKAEATSQRAEKSRQFLSSIFTDIVPWGCGDTVSVLEILDKTSEELSGRFPEDPGIEADLRFAIGKAYQSIGVPDKGRREHETCVRLRANSLGELHDETIDARLNLSRTYSMMGASGDLIENERAILAAAEHWVENDEEEEWALAWAKSRLAGALFDHGSDDEARSYCKQALDGFNTHLGKDSVLTIFEQLRYSRMLLENGQVDEAEDLVRDAYERSIAIHGEYSDIAAEAKSCMASIFIAKHEIDSARVLYGNTRIPHELGIEHEFQGQFDLENSQYQLLIWYETWCPWSHLTMLQLRDMYHHYRPLGLEILALTKLRDPATLEGVEHYLSENEFDFPSFKENGRAWNYFEVEGTPAVRLIHDGYLIWEHRYICNNEVPRRMLEGLVTEGQQ